MKVAVVAESFLPEINGVTNSVLRVLEHLRRGGHQALVVAAGPGPAEYAGAAVERVRAVPLPCYRSFPVALPTRRVERALRAFDPDVVHLASPAALGAVGAVAANKLQVPTVAVFQTDLAGFASRVQVEPIRPGDEHDVRAIFRATLALGAPFPYADDGRRDHLAPYEALCLGWYLGEGAASSAVLREDGVVVGYSLVCVDPAGFARWQRRATIRFLRSIVPRLLLRRVPTPVARFYRHRLRDGWKTWRARRRLPVLPHAHVNVIGRSDQWRGRILAEHADARCRAAGYTAWCGEINTRVGRRAAALERWGANVVHRTPNATLSWVVGSPVERLTILRRVPIAPEQAPRRVA